VTDRPIIFSGPMVRALLEGRKTQTRRLATSPLRKTEPGDRLWVREAHHRTDDDGTPLVGYDFADDPVHWVDRIEDRPGVGRVHFFRHSLGGWGGRSSRNFPSIHMPRWASRLTLNVTAVRVERLQSITEDDADAEGVEKRLNHHGWVDYMGEVSFEDGPWESYRSLWASLHGWDSWSANPEVVALTFTVER
jgi:hypothetical protein